MKLQIYSDASVLGNGSMTTSRTGLGALIFHNGAQYEISTPVDTVPVHRAELRAAAVALIRAAIIIFPKIGEGEVELFSDSAYFVDSFNKILPTSKNDETWELVWEIAAMFQEVKVKHVSKAAYGNGKYIDKADKLAKQGAAKQPPKVKMFAVKITMPDGHYKEQSLKAKTIKEALSQATTLTAEGAVRVEVGMV